MPSASAAVVIVVVAVVLVVIVVVFVVVVRNLCVCVLSRSSMRGMIERLMNGLLQSYNQLVTERSPSDMALSQLRALQLLFDLKFLANILTTSHDDSQVCGFSFLNYFWPKSF